MYTYSVLQWSSFAKKKQKHKLTPSCIHICFAETKLAASCCCQGKRHVQDEVWQTLHTVWIHLEKNVSVLVCCLLLCLKVLISCLQFICSNQSTEGPHLRLRPSFFPSFCVLSILSKWQAKNDRPPFSFMFSVVPTFYDTRQFARVISAVCELVCARRCVGGGCVCLCV